MKLWVLNRVIDPLRLTLALFVPHLVFPKVLVSCRYPLLLFVTLFFVQYKICFSSLDVPAFAFLLARRVGITSNLSHYVCIYRSVAQLSCDINCITTSTILVCGETGYMNQLEPKKAWNKKVHESALSPENFVIFSSKPSKLAK